MNIKGKVISMMLCISMLVQFLPAAFAYEAVETGADDITLASTSSGTNYSYTLGDATTVTGGTVCYHDVDNMITGDDRFALIYNSSHYDEDWVEKEDPVIKFRNMSTGEVTTVTQETSPLKCIEMDHWQNDVYVDGKYNIEFSIPDDLEEAVYYTTIMLYPPQGKETDSRVKPMFFCINSLSVKDNKPDNPGGGSGGGVTPGYVDRTVISDKYYDAAKVCYDLGILPDIYNNYNKVTTKEELAYALVNICGMESQADAAKNKKSNFDDLEVGTYLNGCAIILSQKRILNGDSAGKFGTDTEMKYEQILKCLVDILGYGPLASQKGGYPKGYLMCAAQAGVSKNVSAPTGATVSGEAFAQLIYNSLDAKIMDIKQYTMDGPVYEITNETLLYRLGYYKYTGNAEVDIKSLTISGTEYTLNIPTGTAVTNKFLEIEDRDIIEYDDKGMLLYVLNGSVKSGLNYYYAKVTLNDGEEETKEKELNIAFDVIGYTKYKVNDGEFEYIPDSASASYTLTSGCGKKTVNITVANSSETVTKNFSNSITLKENHKITYLSEGMEFDTQEVECGGEIPELENLPMKEGYTFKEWESLPEVMPDEDIIVKAVFTKDEVIPEVTVFEATLPSASGDVGDTVVINDIQNLIPENMVFGLIYASTIYEDYIYDDAVYTFENTSGVKVYTYKPSPLVPHGNAFKLNIPVPEDLPGGTYKLTIELDIADQKDADDVKPYKFTIDEFVVTGAEAGDDENEPENSHIIFNVADTTTLAPVAGAQITLSVADGSVTKNIVSDSEGKASAALPNGTYNVQVIASGYEIRTFTVEKTDEKYEFSPYLNKNPLVRVETSVKEMTKQEMIDAGIDVNASDNKHVYKCVTVLKFVPAAEGGSVEITPIEINFDYVYDEDGTIIKANPARCDGMIIYPVAKDIYLIIHSEVTWLKEMFDVQLIVANTSAIEKIKDCEITLNLPEGLSLATMTGQQQSLTVDIAEIAPLATDDIHWYVRGDEAGEYIIDGNIIGIREGGGITEELRASFTMQEPITVLAGDAMKLLIEAEKFAEPGTPYKVRYTLENVSDKTLYDVALNVIGGKFLKAYSIEELKHNGTLVDMEGLTGSFNNGYELKKEEFEPGDSLSGVFEIIFAQGVEAEHTRYMVSEMFTFTGEGSTTTIPTEIVLVDSVEDEAEKALAAAIALIDAIGEVTYTEDILSKIVAAEEAIAALTEEQLETIADKIAVLEAAREAYDALTPVVDEGKELAGYEGYTVIVIRDASPAQGQTVLVDGQETFKVTVAGKDVYILITDSVKEDYKVTYADGEAEKVKLGDVDGDGYVTANDAMLTLKKVVMEVAEFTNDIRTYIKADVTGEAGEAMITARDARFIALAAADDNYDIFDVFRTR